MQKTQKSQKRNSKKFKEFELSLQSKTELQYSVPHVFGIFCAFCVRLLVFKL
jgi:hypothetical protein